MKRLVIFLMICMAPVLLVRGATVVERSAIKQLKKVLVSEFEVQEGQKLNGVTTYYSVLTNDSISGYLVLSKSTGLYEKFDFMVYTTSDFETEFIKILRYPTSYGVQVTSKKWLSQFIGNKGNVLKYGQDIQAISGATKSASHLTRDIPKVVRLLKETLQAQ